MADNKIIPSLSSYADAAVESKNNVTNQQKDPLSSLYVPPSSTVPTSDSTVATPPIKKPEVFIPPENWNYKVDIKAKESAVVETKKKTDKEEADYRLAVYNAENSQFRTNPQINPNLGINDLVDKAREIKLEKLYGANWRDVPQSKIDEMDKDGTNVNRKMREFVEQGNKSINAELADPESQVAKNLANPDYVKTRGAALHAARLEAEKQGVVREWDMVNLYAHPINRLLLVKFREEYSDISEGITADIDKTKWTDHGWETVGKVTADVVETSDVLLGIPAKIRSTIEGLEQGSKSMSKANDYIRNAFTTVLKNVKDKQYTPEELSTVDEISRLYHSDFNSYSSQILQKKSELHEKITNLSPAGLLDLSLSQNYVVWNDPNNGGKLTIVSKKSINLKAEGKTRPLRLSDFNLDELNENGKLPFKNEEGDIASRAEELRIPHLADSMLPYGGTPIIVTGGKGLNLRGPRTAHENKFQNKDKLSPTLFAIDENGYGVFSKGKSWEQAEMGTVLGSLYNANSPIGKLEQTLVAAQEMGSGIAYYNTAPESWSSNLKNFVYRRTSLQERAAFWMASVDEAYQQADRSSGNSGAYSPIAEVVRAINPEAGASLNTYMGDNGFSTASTKTRGLMAVHPAVWAGKFAVLGSTAIRYGSVLTKLSKTGLLTAEQIEKTIKFTTWAADAAMAAPVRVAAFTIGYTGRALILGTGGALQGVAWLGGKVAKYGFGVANEAAASVAIKNALKVVGFTDAFLIGGFWRKMYLAAAVGKVAEAGGFTLGKYYQMGGYGFRGVMASAAQDSSLNWIARKTAGVLAEGGMITSAMWDVTKGGISGAGVGYSLEYMHGGHRAGMHGVISGFGMGAAGAGIHTVASRVTGEMHAGIARDMIARRSEMLPPELRQKLLDKIDEEHRNGNYDFATGLVGSIERLDSIGAKTIITDDIGASKNPTLRGDIAHLDPTDFIINGRTFKITDLLNARIDIRNQIDSVSNDASLTPLQKAEAIAKLKTSHKAADEAYHKEVTEYLDAVDKTNDTDLKDRVDANRQGFRGVHIVDADGQQFVYLNIDNMVSTTAQHEMYHAVKHLVAKQVAGKHIASVLFGIKQRGYDAQGNPVEGTYQKGMLDAEDMFKFAQLYLSRKFIGNPDAFNAAMARINEAVQEVKSLDDAGVLSDKSSKILTKMAEEMGASWFEQFVKRKPLDALYLGNKYGKIQTALNRVEMYLKHNTVLDHNALGIKTNLTQQTEEAKIRHARLGELESNLWDGTQRWKNAKEAGASKQELAEISKDIRATVAERNKLLKQNGTSIESVFYNKDGSHLIVPEVEKHLLEILGTTGAKNGTLNFSLDLNGLSGTMLDGHLNSLGLEHWGYKDKDGVTRLKDKSQINEEAVKRGEQMFAEVQKIDPAISGVVFTKDKLGNLRMTGMLSDQMLTILAGLTIKLNGRDEPLMPPSEVLKYQNVREAIKNGFNGAGSMQGNNVLQYLYSALSKEVFDENGKLIKVRRPSGTVEQTFRRVIPYRLEYVLTTFDRDGNKVAPHFEPMVTAVDLGVIYDRMVNEIGKSYSLGDGTVVKVLDLFGSVEALHENLKIYLENLTNNNPDPSAEVFGGGKIGEAKRDILHRILGTIPSGGHDLNGKPMYKNNPIIRPFDVAERGPNFPFTTFRLDLMSNLEMLNQRIPFTDETHDNSQVNYQPPSQKNQTVTKGANGDITKTDFEGEIKLKGKGNILKTNYTIVQADKKFAVQSIHIPNGVTPMFSSRKQAEDYININHNLLEAKLQNALAKTISYNLEGYVVSKLDGGYVIIDGFGTNPSYNQVGTKAYKSFGEAMKEASRLHNANALEIVKNHDRIPSNIYKVIKSLVDSFETSPEALTPRVSIDGNGVIKYKVSLTDTGEPKTYKATHELVKAGIVKEGDPVIEIEMQELNYNLTKTLTGRSSLPETDPALKRAAGKLAPHLVEFVLDSLGDESIAKGYTWYRDFSRRGYETFGSLFPLMCEALGATSAQTPVDDNFKQAREFIRLYSTGHYDEKLATIVQRIQQLHDSINEGPQNGEDRNAWEKRHIVRIESTDAAKSAKAKFGLGKEAGTKQFLAGHESLPAEAIKYFHEELARLISLRASEKLTETERDDSIEIDEKAIIGADDTMLLKENGVKFNMNSEKVTQVAVAKFFDFSDGPKTPQFAKNLMGRNMEATIDLWAARTLHRIANNIVMKNDVWRILPNSETGVKGRYNNKGTAAMPNWVGSGDFFLGQEAFRQALTELQKTHLDKFDGKFIDMTPADLQALIWFAEKNLYDKNRWTDTSGAKKSSFEEPLDRIRGPEDPTGVNQFTQVTNLLIGVSAENNTTRLIQSTTGGKPNGVNIRVRNAAVPIAVTNELKSSIKDVAGKSILGLSVMPTLGRFDGLTEFSIHLQATLERGGLVTKADAVADILNDISNAENLIRNKNIDKARLPLSEHKKIDSEIAAKKAEITKLQEAISVARKGYEEGFSAPNRSNVISHTLDTVMNYGRKYQQRDVIVHEVVGPNHPNARPARNIWFNGSIDGFKASEIMNIVLGEDSYFALSLIPDPVNTNQSKIDSISREIEGLKKKSRDPKISEADRASTEKRIEELTNKTIGLMKFIGMYNVCVPEFKGAKTAEQAKKMNSDYEVQSSEMLERLIGNHENVLTIQDFFTNSIAVNAAGYDTTNPVESGKEANLDFHIQRYNNSLERYEQQKQSTTENNGIGDGSGSVWSPVETQRGSILKGPTTASTNEGRSQNGRASSLGRYTAEDAGNWLARTKASAKELDGGRMYGDKDIQITQLMGNDGKLTNNYTVFDLEARRPMKFVGQQAAEKYVLDRLTGSVMPSDAPRTIERGGKLYEVIESATATPASKELPADAKRGVYDANEPIFDFQPTPEQRRRLERITPEEKKAYDEAMAGAKKGDINAYAKAQRIVEDIAKRLGFTTYYRGTAGLNNNKRSLAEGRENRWHTDEKLAKDAYRTDKNGIVRDHLGYPERNDLWTAPVISWLTTRKFQALQFGTVAANEAKQLGYNAKPTVSTYGVAGNHFDPRDVDHVERVKEVIKKWTPVSLVKMVDKKHGGTEPEWMINLHESKFKPNSDVGRAEHDLLANGLRELSTRKFTGEKPLSRKEVIELMREEIYKNLEDATDSANFESYESDPSDNRKFLLAKIIKDAGFEGYKEKENYNVLEGKNNFRKDELSSLAVFNPKVIKSLNAITYDKAGNPIPIEQRFDTSIDDINYQPMVRDQESPLHGNSITFDHTENGRSKYIQAAYLTLPKNRDIGLTMIKKYFAEVEKNTTTRISKQIGSIENFAEIYQSVTGKDFYSRLIGKSLHDIHETELKKVAGELSAEILKRLSTRLESTEFKDELFQGDKLHKVARDIKDIIGWLESGVTNPNSLSENTYIQRVVRALAHATATKAGAESELGNGFDKQVYKSLDMLSKSEDWVLGDKSLKGTGPDLFNRTLEALKQIDPNIETLIKVMAFSRSYGLEEANRYWTSDKPKQLINIDAVTTASSNEPIAYNASKHLRRGALENLKRFGITFTPEEVELLNLIPSRNDREVTTFDSVHATNTKQYFEQLHADGILSKTALDKLAADNDLSQRDPHFTASKGEASLSYVVGDLFSTIASLRLSLVKNRTASKDNNDWKDAPDFNEQNGGTRFPASEGLTSTTEVNKRINDLEKLRNKLGEIYNGRPHKKNEKRAPYEQVIKQRIASGELKTIAELFAELKSYGHDKVSVTKMMELAGMSTDTLPIDVDNLSLTGNGSGTESNKVDFQLLALVHALSGLQTETNKQAAWIIKPEIRAHALGHEEDQVLHWSNEYLFRTDGDSRTVLEELHHSLLQNNPVYRRLHEVQAMSHASGKDFKLAFEAKIKDIEEEIKLNSNNLLGNNEASLMIGANPVRGNSMARNAQRVDADNGTNRFSDYQKLETASQLIGSTALVTLAKLWIKSFDTPTANFGFSRTVGDTVSNETTPASTHTFNDIGRDVKVPRKEDVRFTGDNRWYSDESLVSKNDYGFKSLVEFAAHALNDRHIQSILLQMEPITVNGEEPVTKIIKDLGTSKDPKVKSYIDKLNSMLAKATNGLQQLYLVLKQLVRFRQTDNHSSQGAFKGENKDANFAQKYAADNAETLKTKRTALEQAIEAAALVRPRLHEGKEQLFPEAVGNREWTSSKGFKRSVNPIEGIHVRGPLNEDLLKYVGRVKKGDNK